MVQPGWLAEYSTISSCSRAQSDRISNMAWSGRISCSSAGPFRQLVKLVILPRVHGLGLKTTVSAVRVSALLCLGEFIHTLDKKAVLDVLQTIQRCTAVDHSAPTVMSTLGVSISILKQYGVEFAAEHVLPLLTAQQLNVQQFAKYMFFVKDILRYKEKWGVTLTDCGIPEVKHATTANGLQSQALGKANGTVASAKSSPEWDEDWVPNTGAAGNASDTAHQPSENDLSFHSILGDKSIQSAHRQSQSSLMPTAPSQQTSVSCPPIDIEWPPRPSSVVNVDRGNGQRQLNIGTSLPSNFEELDPFANWPPRSSTSYDYGTFSNGSMGPGMNNYGVSSITSTTNYQTENGNSWMLGNQNSGALLRPNQGSSTLNADILNGGGPQKSIGFLKQNQRVSAPMSSSYNNQKSADIGSICGSSKKEQTATRLAPPPSTADIGTTPSFGFNLIRWGGFYSHHRGSRWTGPRDEFCGVAFIATTEALVGPVPEMSSEQHPGIGARQQLEHEQQSHALRLNELHLHDSSSKELQQLQIMQLHDSSCSYPQKLKSPALKTKSSTLVRSLLFALPLTSHGKTLARLLLHPRLGSRRGRHHLLSVVYEHLIIFGFLRGYKKWIFHGELTPRRSSFTSNPAYLRNSHHQSVREDNMKGMMRIVRAPQAEKETNNEKLTSVGSSKGPVTVEETVEIEEEHEQTNNEESNVVDSSEVPITVEEAVEIQGNV
ncbi:uncharacterized protein LOC120118861 [Hibiscus syriacus]|uniref:uncharacterized protein LOC120118861 n=1 Tax=Hibiscus syriacus TaxID=106335 RepID=UPI0019206FE6|nr:uncharacterized protein LOC120118861 [Hibiscus syriacus]